MRNINKNKEKFKINLCIKSRTRKLKHGDRKFSFFFCMHMKMGTDLSVYVLSADAYANLDGAFLTTQHVCSEDV